jgi:hypothetical protein
MSRTDPPALEPDISFNAAAIVLFPEATPPVNPMQRSRLARKAKTSEIAHDVNGEDDNEAAAIAAEVERRETAAEKSVGLRDLIPYTKICLTLHE